MSAELDRAELEARLARHERTAALREATDATLEHALRQRLPIERVMPRLLELLRLHTGAESAALRTLDEALQERTFAVGAMDLDEALERGARGEQAFAHGERTVLAHSLDVAGEPFGTCVCALDRAAELDTAGSLLHAFCEEVDNHLAAIAAARHRYEVIRAISDALKSPVLDHGIEEAVQILKRELDFADLILVFRHEDDLESDVVRYRVYLDGALRHESSDPREPELDAFLREHACAFLDGDDAAVRQRFGIARYREEVLISGVRDTRVIGRMIAVSRHGEFHTYDRELLDRFADYLRQRIVDFNREWKQLAMVFSRPVCERLLRDEAYVQRWLTPREAEVAVLYADISGFTRICEEVLRSPEAVGRLIHTWADEAVRIVWDTGGVFDKMVGDCIIALWGPPFFERAPAELCRGALEAARRLREHTRALASHRALPELRGVEIDVAIGVSFCPLSVGLFGPDHDYTGFGSGMNNTARLQGVARAGEILCMERLVEALGDSDRFGERREAAVKNVREPLVFRPLR